jgi:hypothetical protein
LRKVALLLLLLATQLQARWYFVNDYEIIRRSLNDLTAGAEVYNVLKNYCNDDDPQVYSPNNGSVDLHFKHSMFMKMTPEDDVMEYAFGGTWAKVVMRRDLISADLEGKLVKNYTYTLNQTYYLSHMTLTVQVFRDDNTWMGS